MGRSKIYQKGIAACGEKKHSLIMYLSEEGKHAGYFRYHHKKHSTQYASDRERIYS